MRDSSPERIYSKSCSNDLESGHVTWTPCAAVPNPEKCPAGRRLPSTLASCTRSSSCSSPLPLPSVFACTDCARGVWTGPWVGGGEQAQRSDRVLGGRASPDDFAAFGCRGHVTDAPPDPILAVGVAFNADTVRPSFAVNCWHRWSMIARILAAYSCRGSPTHDAPIFAAPPAQTWFICAIPCIISIRSAANQGENALAPLRPLIAPHVTHFQTEHHAAVATSASLQQRTHPHVLHRRPTR